MTKLESGLSRPYQTSKYAALERLRRAAWDGIWPGASSENRASRIAAWAISGELRSLFPGLSRGGVEFSDGPNTLDLAGLLDGAVPDDMALARALAGVGFMSDALLTLTEAHRKSDIPSRRIQGYLAVLCGAAMGRTDE